MESIPPDSAGSNITPALLTTHVGTPARGRADHRGRSQRGASGRRQVVRGHRHPVVGRRGGAWWLRRGHRVRGKPGLLDACIAAARPKGRIVVAGVCTEQDPFWSIAVLTKELTIHFAVYYTPDEFRTVLEAFGSGAIEPGRLCGTDDRARSARRSLRPTGRGYDPRQDPHRSGLGAGRSFGAPGYPALEVPGMSFPHHGRVDTATNLVFSALRYHRHVLAGS